MTNPDERERASIAWVMLMSKSGGVHYIKAEAPCWKGEIVLWRVVIGWQR